MIQRALANGTSPEMVPRSEMVSGPSSTDFWVNGLWFTSLTLSLCTALLAVLVKQWLHQYMSPTSGTYRDRSLIRQYRYDGLQKWRVMTIVGLLPIVLHITLCFFLVGLVVFLFPLSRPLAYVVASITVIVYGMYFILNILPLAYSQCPYRTPFSDILNVFVHAVPSLFLPFMTFVRGQLKEALSQANGIPTSDESSSESSAHVAASIREFFQHQLRSARRDVVAALDLEAPPPISPKGIPTLKDIERRASAAASHKIIETISFDAVSWLIRTTSNLPTKSIAVQSLGSFSVALKSDLRTLGHEVDFQAFLSPLIKTVTQWIYMVSVPLPGEDRRVERLYRARFACGIVDNPEQVHFFLAGLRFPRSDASEIPFSLEATFLTSGCDLFHEDGTQWASTDFLSRIVIASQTGKFIVLPIHVWQGIFLHCLSRNHSLPTLPTRFGVHLTHLCVLAFPTTTSPDPESDYNSEGPALVPIIHPSLRSSLQRLLYLTLIFKTKYTPNPLLPDSIELQSLLMVHNFLLFSYSLSPNAALAGLRGVWKEIVSFSQNSQLTQQTFQAICTSAEQLLSLLTDDAEAQKSFEVLFSYDGLDEEERDYVELDPKAVHLYHDWVRLNYTALSKSSTGNTETDFSPLLLQLVVNRLLGVCTSCPPETIHHPQISRLLQTWTDSLYRDVPHAYEKFVEVDFLSLITPETVTYVFATYCLIVGGFVLGLSRRSLPPDLHRRCVAYLHMTHHLFAVCGVMALAKSRESDWRGYLFEYIFDRKATLSLLASIEPDHPVWQQRAAYMCGEDAPSFPPTEEDTPFPECYQLGLQELDAFFEDREVCLWPLACCLS